MVETQIATRRWDPLVLMRCTVPCTFVGKSCARRRTKTTLPIPGNQTISQPYIVALMTELLELSPNDRVLEIGTGSGYQSAVLSKLCREVYTIEIVPELARERRERLAQLSL
jgi:protein-L-isoaspartate O-methyltransferase